VIQSRSRNLGASVRQRLLNLAREKSEAFDLVLTRYGLERLLYRIGRSPWRTRFLLKGAMLYTLWYGLYDLIGPPDLDLPVGFYTVHVDVKPIPAGQKVSGSCRFFIYEK